MYPSSSSSTVVEVEVLLSEADMDKIRHKQKVQYRYMVRFLIVSAIGVGAVVWTYLISKIVLMFFALLLLIPSLFVVWVVSKTARLLRAELNYGKKNQLKSIIQEIKMQSTGETIAPVQTSALLVVDYPYEASGKKTLGVHNQPNYFPKVGEQTVIDYLPRSTFVLAAHMVPLSSSPTDSGIYSSPE